MNDNNNNIQVNDDRLVIPQNNTFINTTTQDINVQPSQEGTVNTPKAPVDYSQEQRVKENMQRKNTINVSSDGKVMILIGIIILLFIFLLPMIYSYLN